MSDPSMTGQRKPMSRLGKFTVAAFVLWLLSGLLTLGVFVASLTTESEVEAALNAKYDADIVFERYRRREDLTIDGKASPCWVEGDLGSLDDVQILCPATTEPPPLRRPGATR